MALREGDSITVRRSAVIHLTQYDALKPWVSMTRTLGEDPEADREDMDRTLYVELRRAVLIELQDRTGLQGALDKSTTQLTKHCEKVIADGPQGHSASEEEGFPKRASRKKKVGSKKTGRKKTARRRSEA